MKTTHATLSAGRDAVYEPRARQGSVPVEFHFDDGTTLDGDLVHIDIKKLGNIPDGGGHKALGRQAGRKNRARAGMSFLHNAVDDHSRLAYSEILADEKKETAVGFWQRAHAFFAAAGITVQRVLTDNGACCKSHLWRNSLTEQGIAHKRTRPYRPQTNGKAERFNRTLLDEWAYAKTYRTETERRDAYPRWLHTYNHHRGHTALKGQPPASRAPTPRVSTPRARTRCGWRAASCWARRPPMDVP